MVDTVAETEEFPQEGETETRPVRQTEVTLEMCDRAARLGRSIFRLATARSENRLTPYLDPQRFPREDLHGLRQRNREETLTTDDFQEAERASFAVALEAATQVVQARLPGTGSVREDLQSLETLTVFMQQGNRLREELMEEDPSLVAEQTKGVMARWSRKDPATIETNGTALNSWAEDQFQKAGQRLMRANEAMRAYLGR